MGLLDALASSSFRTTKDGQRLFFPWGIFGHSYLISSEDFRRIHHALKVYWGIALSLGIATSIATSAVSSLLVGPRGHFVVAVTVALLFVSPYAILVRIQCQRLQRASERLRFGEEIERQAREQSAVGLWVLAIGSLLSVAMGLVIVFVEPAEWIAGLVFLVGGGLSALVFARMLLVRWRTRASRS